MSHSLHNPQLLTASNFFWFCCITTVKLSKWQFASHIILIYNLNGATDV